MPSTEPACPDTSPIVQASALRPEEPSANPPAAVSGEAPASKSDSEGCESPDASRDSQDAPRSDSSDSSGDSGDRLDTLTSALEHSNVGINVVTPSQMDDLLAAYSQATSEALRARNPPPE